MSPPPAPEHEGHDALWTYADLRLSWRTLAVTSGLFASTLFAVHLHGGWAVTEAGVTVLTGMGRALVWGTVLAAWAGATVRFVRMSRNPATTLAILAGPTILTICVGGFGVFGSLIWHVRGRLVTSDGRELVALYCYDFDAIQAIGRVVEKVGLSERIEFLCREESYPGLAGAYFLPARLADREHLYLEEIPDGVVVLLWNDAEWGEHGAVLAVAPDGERRQLPPFALFGPGDTGEDAVLDKAVALRLRFDDAELCAALDHGSEWVRRAATSITKVGDDEWYPTASARLAERAASDR